MNLRRRSARPVRTTSTSKASWLWISRRQGVKKTQSKLPRNAKSPSSVSVSSHRRPRYQTSVCLSFLTYNNNARRSSSNTVTLRRYSGINANSPRRQWSRHVFTVSHWTTAYVKRRLTSQKRINNEISRAASSVSSRRRPTTSGTVYSAKIPLTLHFDKVFSTKISLTLRSDRNSARLQIQKAQSDTETKDLAGGQTVGDVQVALDTGQCAEQALYEANSRRHEHDMQM